MWWVAIADDVFSVVPLGSFVQTERVGVRAAGHSFCLGCLESCLARCGRKCPQCRTHVPGRTRLQTNTALAGAIRLLFGTEVTGRAQRQQVAVAQSSLELSGSSAELLDEGDNNDNDDDPDLLLALAESRRAVMGDVNQRQWRRRYQQPQRNGAVGNPFGGATSGSLESAAAAAEAEREQRRRRRNDSFLRRTVEDEGWLDTS